MADSFKAATRIKTGTKEDGFEYLERGDEVSKSDFTDEEWKDLVSAEAVVEAERFDALFPEVVEGQNQASGTPSNLGQVEGTELQVNPPPEGEDAPTAPAATNPADPPTVDGAVTPGGDNDTEEGLGSDAFDEDDEDDTTP